MPEKNTRVGGNERRRVTRERWGWTLAAMWMLGVVVAQAWQRDPIGTGVAVLGLIVCVVPAAVEWGERWRLT